jgi:hypothetical protein
MKKLIIISFVLALLMSAVAVAQYGTQPPDNSKSSMSTKAVSITGKISGLAMMARCSLPTRTVAEFLC